MKLIGFQGVASIALLICTAVHVTPVGAADYPWTFQTAAQVDEPLFQIQQEWVDRIGTMSGGRIAIEIVPVDAFAEYDGTLEAVARNIIQGHITYPVYFGDQDPAFALLGNPIGVWEHPFQMMRFMEYGGGNELYRELFESYGLYFIGVLWTGREALVSDKPIRTVDDLKGTRISVLPGPVWEVLKAADAVPVDPFAAETTSAKYVALADQALPQPLRSVRYLVWPGVGPMLTMEVSMNMQIWKSLPEDLKEIMTIATRDFSRDLVMRLELQAAAATVAAQEKGVQIVCWSGEEQQRFRSIIRRQWKRWAERSEAGRKMESAVVAWLGSKERLGFQPDALPLCQGWAD